MMFLFLVVYNFPAISLFAHPVMRRMSEQLAENRTRYYSGGRLVVAGKSNIAGTDFPILSVFCETSRNARVR